MTPERNRSRHHQRHKFLLMLVSLLPFISLFAGAVFSVYQYSKSNEWSGLWLPSLLFIPVVSQFFCAIGMFTHYFNKNVFKFTNPYLMSIFLMTGSSALYFFLLYMYPAENTYSSGSSKWLSYLALIFIILLITIVVFMTYVILSLNDHHLSEGDILNYDKICQTFQRIDNKKIYELLLAELHIRLLYPITSLKDLKAQVPLPHFLVAFNKFLSNPEAAVQLVNNLSPEAKEDFKYDIEQMEDLHSHEIFQMSRQAWTKQYSGHIKSNDPVRLRRLRMGLRSSKHYMRLIATEIPFWTIVLFLTVFLSISYLFGFAFAFHDKSERDRAKQEAASTDKAKLENASVAPPLYKVALNPTPTPMPTPTANTTPTPLPAPLQPASTDPSINSMCQTVLSEAIINRVVFFESFSASPQYNFPNKPNKENVRWREEQNKTNLENLSKAIRACASAFSAIKVEIIGTADDNRVSTPSNQNLSTYASNYELSEARASNLKNLLIKHVGEIDDRVVPNNVEWIVVSLSNDLPLHTTVGFPKVNQISAREVRNTVKQKRDSITSAQLSDPNKRELKDYLDRIVKLVGEGKLNEDEASKVMSIVDEIDRLQNPGNAGANSTPLNCDMQKRELNEYLEYYDKVDPDARKRIAEARVIPIQERPQQPLAYESLTLMDYIYFAMYTITTTGYGDIIPTTSYAKFLCTLANIIEVFFIVVFFNALLAVRHEREGA